MCVRVPASTAPLRQSRPNHRKGDNRSPAPRRLACLGPLQWTRHSLLRCPLLQSRPGTCLLRHMLCDRDVLPSAKPLKRIDLPMLHAFRLPANCLDAGAIIASLQWWIGEKGCGCEGGPANDGSCVQRSQVQSKQKRRRRFSRRSCLGSSTSV